MTIGIRLEASADITAIEAVTVAAFLNAPHTSHTEQFMVAALRRAGALAVSLMAVEEGAVIGHVAVSPVVIADGAAGWYGLGQISVLPGVSPEFFQVLLLVGAMPHGVVSYHATFGP